MAESPPRDAAPWGEAQAVSSSDDAADEERALSGLIETTASIHQPRAASGRFGSSAPPATPKHTEPMGEDSPTSTIMRAAKKRPREDAAAEAQRERELADDFLKRAEAARLRLWPAGRKLRPACVDWYPDIGLAKELGYATTQEVREALDAELKCNGAANSNAKFVGRTCIYRERGGNVNLHGTGRRRLLVNYITARTHVGGPPVDEAEKRTSWKAQRAFVDDWMRPENGAAIFAMLSDESVDEADESSASTFDAWLGKVLSVDPAVNRPTRALLGISRHGSPDRRAVLLAAKRTLRRLADHHLKPMHLLQTGRRLGAQESAAQPRDEGGLVVMSAEAFLVACRESFPKYRDQWSGSTKAGQAFLQTDESKLTNYAARISSAGTMRSGRIFTCC